MNTGISGIPLLEFVVDAGRGCSRCFTKFWHTFCTRIEASCNNCNLYFIAQAFIDNRTEDNISIRIRCFRNNFSCFINFKDAQIRLPEILSKMPFAPSMEVSNNGLLIAIFAASTARFHLRQHQSPSRASPCSVMIVLTSAKSRLIKPGI